MIELPRVTISKDIDGDLLTQVHEEAESLVASLVYRLCDVRVNP